MLMLYQSQKENLSWEITKNMRSNQLSIIRLWQKDKDSIARLLLLSLIKKLLKGKKYLKTLSTSNISLELNQYLS